MDDLDSKLCMLVEGIVKDKEIPGYYATTYEIPANAQVLKIGRCSYPLFCKTTLFVAPNQLFYFPNAKGGWPLGKIVPKIEEYFSNPRSVISKDGRFFVNENYLVKDYRRYLANMFDIFEAAAEVFKKKDKIEEG